jgi:hypothetical protein
LVFHLVEDEVVLAAVFLILDLDVLSLFL